MKNQIAPTATARITIRKTGTGSVLLVSVVTPESVAFRAYTHEIGCDFDRAVAAALKSCGVSSAWTWGRLS